MNSYSASVNEWFASKGIIKIPPPPQHTVIHLLPYLHVTIATLVMTYIHTRVEVDGHHAESGVGKDGTDLLSFCRVVEAEVVTAAQAYHTPCTENIHIIITSSSSFLKIRSLTHHDGNIQCSFH